MAKKYKSEALKAAHETAIGMHRLGLIDAKIMHDLDVLCLISVEKLQPPQHAVWRRKAAAARTDL